MYEPIIHLGSNTDSTLVTIDPHGNVTFKDGTKLESSKLAQLLKASEQQHLTVNYRPTTFFRGVWTMVFSSFANDNHNILAGLPQVLDGTTALLGLVPGTDGKDLPGNAVQGAAAAADSLYVVLTDDEKARDLNRVLFKVDTDTLKAKSTAIRLSDRFSAICSDGLSLSKAITNDAVAFIGNSINKSAKFLADFSATGMVFSDQAREALTYYNDRFLKAHDTHRKNKAVQTQAQATATDQVAAQAREEGRAQARVEMNDALSKVTKPA